MPYKKIKTQKQYQGSKTYANIYQVKQRFLWDFIDAKAKENDVNNTINHNHHQTAKKV